MKKLNWGMLGTGWIAHEMGEALKRVNGEIYACCATSMESAEKYAEEYSILQVGTGDSPLTVPLYEKCGFVRSHNIPNFFTDNYDHPIYECGVQLIDMVYLQRCL